MGLPSTDWLVRPVAPIDEAGASAVLATRFGVRGTVRDLGSQQDRNYGVRGDAGEYVLKVANPATHTAELRSQCDAVEHLARALPGLRLPRARPGADGDVVQPFLVDGATLSCRLLDFVPGEPIMDSRYLAPVVVTRLGELAGQIAATLADFTAPETDRFRPWDLRNALEVIETLAPHWPDRARAGRVLRAARTAHALVEPHAKDLPVQFVHGDITDNNVVCETARDGRRMPVGVIDFGDLGTGWTVAELAVTCTSVLHHHGSGPASVLPAVRAFDAVRPLADGEAAVLWPLVVLRAAVMVVSGQYDVLQDPGNGYASAALDREWAMFESAVSVPAEVMTAQLRQTLGRPLPRVAVVPTHRMLPDLPDDVPALDLSPQSDDLHTGRWLEADAEAAQASGLAAARTRHGEFRMTRTTIDTKDAPATCALGVDLHLADPLEVHAPWAGTLTRHADGTLDLRGEGPVLWLYGVDSRAASGPVAAGQPLGTVAERDGRHTLGLRLSTLADRHPPRFATPDLAAGWLAVSPDPTRLITGQDPVEPSADKDLLARRDRAFAPVQEHYYDDPPRIERGWRHHLVDAQGRGCLDMLNNVTVLGHGHPALSDAVHRQWRRLNTNSRFHYGSVVELSERLTALLPEELDTVFLVNSGSEAVDLALRLAWAATGRQDTVAVEEAYHGWTYASDAVSTSIADNPNALSSRPSWVHTVAAPNSYRGRRRGAEARRYGPEAAARITELAEQGRPPAAFICEPFYGNAGGIPSRTATSGRSTTPRAPSADCASRTRCRSATADSAPTSGDSSSRASYRTSSPWPRRWGTGIRWAP